MSTIRDGGTILKDPQGIEVYGFDWDDRLATAALIGTSTFIVSGADAALTTDNAGIATGSRATQVRLLGGTLGLTYILTNRVVTTEGPAQTLDASVRVVIQQQ